MNMFALDACCSVSSAMRITLYDLLLRPSSGKLLRALYVSGCGKHSAQLASKPMWSCKLPVEWRHKWIMWTGMNAVSAVVRMVDKSRCSTWISGTRHRGQTHHHEVGWSGAQLTGLSRSCSYSTAGMLLPFFPGPVKNNCILILLLVHIVILATTLGSPGGSEEESFCQQMARERKWNIVLWRCQERCNKI